VNSNHDTIAHELSRQADSDTFLIEGVFTGWEEEEEEEEEN